MGGTTVVALSATSQEVMVEQQTVRRKARGRSRRQPLNLSSVQVKALVAATLET